MKYSKRKDKYCNNVLNDNFHEIDDRLKSLEKGGGGSGGGSNTVYLKQVEYDALPDTKLSDDVEYRITDSGTESVKASNVKYDNSFTGLKAVNVQGAVDEVIGSLTNEDNESFNFGVKDGVRGFFTDPSRADDSFVPFSSGYFEIVNMMVLGPGKSESYNGKNFIAFMALKFTDGNSRQHTVVVKNGEIVIDNVNYTQLSITYSDDTLTVKNDHTSYNAETVVLKY